MSDVAIDIHRMAAALPERSVIEVAAPESGPPIDDLTHDSRDVRPGWAFACVVGERADGHDFAGEAVAAGAVALLVERRLPLDVPQIVVDDVRAAMGLAAAAVHGRPSERLATVGITGTNGKTTTTHLVAWILGAAGRDVRQVGTLTGVRTTPEAPDLQRTLAGFVRDGADAVVMEVSSHALALHRVAGTRFDVAVFTNLGRDHLDLHGSMESYFRAKASLFDARLSAHGVINADDPYGQLLLDASEIPTTRFGTDELDDVVAHVDRISFVWRGHPVSVPLGGSFNVSNVAAALTAAVELGIDAEVAVAALASVPPVPGRFETVSDPERDGVAVVVDYAHTPDGLVALLESARSVAGRGRVIVTFGCGGDRDVDKRPLMGAAASEHADLVVITSDNPRSEDPQSIVDAALAGVESGYRGRVLVEVDRREAIRRAIGGARPGDVVVIAGKGHETTQTIGDTVLPFDDRAVAREVLAESDAHDGTGASS